MTDRVALLVGGPAHGSLIAMERPEYVIRVAVPRTPMWKLPEVREWGVNEKCYFRERLHVFGRQITVYVDEDLGTEERNQAIFDALITNDGKAVAE